MGTFWGLRYVISSRWIASDAVDGGIGAAHLASKASSHRDGSTHPRPQFQARVHIFRQGSARTCSFRPGHTAIRSQIVDCRSQDQSTCQSPSILHIFWTRTDRHGGNTHFPSLLHFVVCISLCPPPRSSQHSCSMRSLCSRSTVPRSHPYHGTRHNLPRPSLSRP